MASKPTLVQRIASRQDLLLALAIFAAVLAVMAVLTMTLGVHNGGPSYEIVADPGPGLPF